MDVSSISTTSQPSIAAGVAAQPAVQPQEQQARNLRSERERDDATRANDQVTLSAASSQITSRETERVVPQTEVTAATDKSQEKDRVEQVRQAQIESRREQQPAPRSVANALQAYTQISAL
jgi:hypothetical protein